MAKDDYFVIVYEILKYLYEQLKNGKKADPNLLTAEYYNVNPFYWAYILVHLKEDGFVEGYQSINTKDGWAFTNLGDALITPFGIEYLFDNHLMSKVKRTLKDAKEMTPFI